MIGERSRESAVDKAKEFESSRIFSAVMQWNRIE
jgi:hypothetical protein